MRPNNPFKEVNNYSTLPFSCGSASNVQDFIDKVVKPQFAGKSSVIKATHEAIVKYLLKDDPIYFLRLYGGSFPPADYPKLRRGFLTEYPNGTRMAFCDNFFARIFIAMKLAGIPYTDDDLFEYLSQQNLICGFGSTKEERELQYYSNKYAIKVDFTGLYLAHIKPTGENLEGKSISSIFPNPDRNDWDPNRKLRDILSTKGSLKDLTSDELKFLIAHFVRLIHPLNSFFVPNTNHLSYSYGKETKHLIGEEEDLIVCVQEYLKETFPEEYALFDSISLKCDFNCACGQNNNIKDIHWDMSILPKENEDEPQDEKNECKDANEDQSDNKDAALERKLNSIGKDVFVNILYPILVKNPNATIKDVIKAFPKYGKYSEKSQKTRLSDAKWIFDNGLEGEALEIIKNSKIVANNHDLLKKIEGYLKDLEE